MKLHLFHSSVKNLSERLTEPLHWYPFPALIAFGLVIVLRGHLFDGLNHRLGTTANVLEMNSEPLRSPGIWLSVSEINNQIVIITDDHRRFSIPLATRDLKDMEPLVLYLDKRVKEIAFKSTLNLEVDQDRVRAVLAVDQSLRYFHIRPILYALAEAKISHYGFETRLTTAQNTKDHSSTHDSHSKEHH